MVKYQEPQMEIIEFGIVQVITESLGNLYEPSDGKNTGGSDSGGWNDF